jgi:hypothetical protein
MQIALKEDLRRTYYLVRLQVLTAASMKMAVFWDVAPCSLMTEAASASETSVNFYQTTWRNIPEDRYLLTTSFIQCSIYMVRLSVNMS